MKFGNDAFAMLQLQAGVPELLLIAQLRLCPLLHGMTCGPCREYRNRALNQTHLDSILVPLIFDGLLTAQSSHCGDSVLCLMAALCGVLMCNFSPFPSVLHFCSR